MTAVDIFALDLDDIGAAAWPRLHALLDESEQARAARFVFEPDRHAYIAAHALLRRALSARVDVAPRDWRFATAARGKPYLIATPRDLRFSLSHTRGMTAVAVVEGYEIGVDVEEPRGAREPLKLAARFFAADETAALRAIDDEAAQREAFLRIWTMKEAVIKATGQGLACALDSFSVALEPLAVAFHNGDDAQWSFGHWRRNGFHVACALRGADVKEAFALHDAAALIHSDLTH